MTEILQAVQKWEKLFALDTGGDIRLESERALIEQARTSASAFGQLYDIHYNAILNYIYSRALNASVAEELTSNTFLKALNALPKYHHKAPFRAWLYRIALNEIRMHFRKEKRRRSIENTFLLKEDLERVYFPGPDILSVEEREEHWMQYALLHQEISALPMRYQEVITLRFFENLEYSEIAQILGKKMGTVKSLIHRGLKRLKTRMEKKTQLFQKTGIENHGLANPEPTKNVAEAYHETS